MTTIHNSSSFPSPNLVLLVKSTPRGGELRLPARQHQRKSGTEDTDTDSPPMRLRRHGVAAQPTQRCRFVTPPARTSFRRADNVDHRNTAQRGRSTNREVVPRQPRSTTGHGDRIASALSMPRADSITGSPSPPHSAARHQILHRPDVARLSIVRRCRTPAAVPQEVAWPPYANASPLRGFHHRRHDARRACVESRGPVTSPRFAIGQKHERR